MIDKSGAHGVTIFSAPHTVCITQQHYPKSRRSDVVNATRDDGNQVLRRFSLLIRLFKALHWNSKRRIWIVKLLYFILWERLSKLACFWTTSKHRHRFLILTNLKNVRIQLKTLVISLKIIWRRIDNIHVRYVLYILWCSCRSTIKKFSEMWFVCKGCAACK